MKKAYNPDWVRNVLIQDLAQSWFEKNLFTSEQMTNVKTLFPEDFYKPGLFVKIGLFIFGVVACLFFGGFLSLFILEASNGDAAITAICIISSVAFVIALESLIRSKKLFHSGVDNAILYSALATLITPFFILYNNPPVWLSCSVALAICIPAFLRYADMLVMIVGYVLAMILLSNLMMQFPLGAALLPFGLMIFSGVLFEINRRIEPEYYKNCQSVWKALCLATFYLGGNYLIVREGNSVLNDLQSSVAPQIPFAFIFYIFTILIPVAYVVKGVQLRDRILLILGLVTFAFSTYTGYHYLGSLSPEVAVTLAGLLMILFSAAFIAFLKTPKLGLSDEVDRKREIANLSAILVAQQLGQTPVDEGIQFGGGSFGGGGAESGY